MSKHLIIDCGSTSIRYGYFTKSTGALVDHKYHVVPNTFKEVPLTRIMDVQVDGTKYGLSKDYGFLMHSRIDRQKAYCDIVKPVVGYGLYHYQPAVREETEQPLKIHFAVATNINSQGINQIKRTLGNSLEVCGQNNFKQNYSFEFEVVHQGFLNSLGLWINNQDTVLFDIGFVTSDYSTLEDYGALNITANKVLTAVGGKTNSSFSLVELSDRLEQIKYKTSATKETTKLLKENTQSLIEKYLYPVYEQQALTQNSTMTIGGGFGRLLQTHGVSGLKFLGKNPVCVSDGFFSVIDGFRDALVNGYDI